MSSSISEQLIAEVIRLYPPMSWIPWMFNGTKERRGP